jgi:uncharacterized damage-inducible protein DinB
VKSFYLICALSLLLAGSGAPRAPGAKPGQIHIVSQALDFWISNTENLVVPAAEALAAEKYSFGPTAGEFTGVRTFGQQIKHLAANNYAMAAYILNQTPTLDQTSETVPDSAQSKAQIMEYVKGSFAALHRAMAAINEANVLEPMPSSPSPRQTTRLQLAEDVVAHSSNHYGQLVEYLRRNGIVPPASRP